MTLARRNNPERFEMLQPAARLRAFAGALCCALVLAAAITHQARADDAPGRAGEFARAWRIAPPAPRRHVPRVRVQAREASRLGRAWSASHPLVRTALADLGRGKFTAHPGPWCADALVAWGRRAGYRMPATRRAADFARYGRPTAPRPGTIVVSRHHVGIVVAVSRGRVTMVSGNWGGRVRLGRPAGVIAYRAPV